MTGPDRKWGAGRPLTIGFLTLAVLFGGLGGWAATARISGAVIAGGQIEVDQNRQVVQHPDGGVVSEILVEEGDTVGAGDVLIRLDPETLQSELSVVEGQLFEIVARRGRHEAERDGTADIQFDPLIAENDNPIVADLMEGQRRLLIARSDSEASAKAQLEKRAGQIADQIVGLVAQQRSVGEQTALINQELSDQQTLLERGLAQASRVLALQREAANLEGTAGELAAAVAQAQGRITEIDLQILDLETRRREEAITTLRDLSYNELELRERRRFLIARLDRLDIRAPVSGIVYGMQVFGTQSVVRPAEPVLFLVPQDRPLVIATQIQTRDIDQLYIGQEVALRFSAFDQRRTPELYGAVTKISADAFQDESSRVSYYRAEIVLSEGEAARLPQGMTLIPGMPVEAFLQTADRSPLEYLVKPFADFFAKAFREN